MDTDRRRLLAAAGAGVASLAGCLGGGGTGGGDASGNQVTSMPAPTMGDPDAPVTVAAFTDYACPHCKHWMEEAFPSIRKQYVEPGRAVYVHNDFPIPVHPRWSWAAAEAARAVQDRTPDAYFEFAHGLYELQGNFSLGGIRKLAEGVGVDGTAVVEDVKTDVYRPVVKADRQDGLQRGVEGTPTIFVAGESVRPTTERVAAAIEEARG